MWKGVSNLKTGEKIKAKRREFDLTQEELANKLGVTIAAVSKRFIIGNGFQMKVNSLFVLERQKEKVASAAFPFCTLFIDKSLYFANQHCKIEENLDG